MKRHRDSDKQVAGAGPVKSCRVRAGVNVIHKQKLWGSRNHEKAEGPVLQREQDRCPEAQRQERENRDRGYLGS